MRSVEVEGDSIDDAIRKALVELGVTRDRASIEILNDATRGIFGFGGQKARVRAAVRAPLAETLAALDGPTPRQVSRETERVPTPATAVQAPRPATPRLAERAPDRASERPRASRETEPEARRLAPNFAKAPAPSRRPTSPTGRPSPAPPTDELATRSRAVLLELLSHLGGQCEVSSQPTSDPTLVSLTVQGASSALLIGKHGQTLDAIEYLLNRIVIRDAGGTTRIEVDVEGYRARREQGLIATARRIAGKVRETGKPATVEAMNPRDRRIVHMALKDESGVTSRSQGDGFLRKLVILPAGGRRRSEPRSTRDGE